MGCRILYDQDSEQAALYCSTTERAFGPIFHDEGEGADAEAQAFLKWLKGDARRYTETELNQKHSEWLVARKSICELCGEWPAEEGGAICSVCAVSPLDLDDHDPVLQKQPPLFEGVDRRPMPFGVHDGADGGLALEVREVWLVG